MLIADSPEGCRSCSSGNIGLWDVQDYVKWRGQLFHQFMRALVDDSHQVRALANFLLADALSSKVSLPRPPQTHNSMYPRS